MGDFVASKEPDMSKNYAQNDDVPREIRDHVIKYGRLLRSQSYQTRLSWLQGDNYYVKLPPPTIPSNQKQL